MENKRLSKQLKTPSPPAKVKLFFESLDNLDRERSTSGNQTTNSESSLNHEAPLINNYGLNYVQNQLESNHLNKINSHHENQPINQLNKTNNQHYLNQSNNNSIQYGLKTEDYDNESPIEVPLSNESRRGSFTCRSKLSNTGDAYTGILKKYKEIQAKSKVSLVLDDTDEEELNNDDEQISDTPSFRCTSDEEEEEDFCSSQSPQPNSLESSSSNNKVNNNKLSQNQLNRRHYKSEPQLSSFEDSEDNSIKSGGMYQDSIRYHSQTLKKSTAKVFETIKVGNVDYFILNLIGEGGSSKVYQVCDCQKNEFYALKVVDMGKMQKNLQISLKKEIEILKMLKDCKRVIKLYAYEWNQNAEKLMLIMEKGDSDLNAVLNKMIQTDNNNGNSLNKKPHLDLHTIKHYWNEMLKAVDEIHGKGIIHSDLKPVNFVIVKGYLKIIDFGIADAINPDHTSVLKSNLVGTINFMSPESFNSHHKNGEKLIKVNQKSDVWSLGCILYTMIYGRTPFGHCESVIDKVTAICNASIKYYPYEDPNAIDCVKRCLQKEQQKRPTVKELFDHPFLSNKDKSSTFSVKKTQPQTRVPIPARNPTTEKHILQGLGFNPNDVSPRTLNRLKNVIKKEFPSIMKK